MPDTTYLLDTGLLLGYARDAGYARHVDEEYAPLDSPSLAFLSVVSRGEMFSLAYQFGWGQRKRRSLQSLLSDLPTLHIHDEEIITRYAEIDAFSQGKLKGRPLPNGLTSRNMGKNDLWIAATASVIEATLLTTDDDFDHLHDEYLQRIYIDPSTPDPNRA